MWMIPMTERKQISTRVKALIILTRIRWCIPKGCTTNGEGILMASEFTCLHGKPLQDSSVMLPHYGHQISLPLLLLSKYKYHKALMPVLQAFLTGHLILAATFRAHLHKVFQTGRNR